MLTAEQQVWVQERARAAGFDLAGVAQIPVPESADAAAMPAGLPRGLRMDATARWRGLRERPRPAGCCASIRIFPCRGRVRCSCARSITTRRRCGRWMRRRRGADGLRGTRGAERTARRREPVMGSDYHDVLLEKLRVVEAELRARWGLRSRRAATSTQGRLSSEIMRSAPGLDGLGRIPVC